MVLNLNDVVGTVLFYICLFASDLLPVIYADELVIYTKVLLDKESIPDRIYPELVTICVLSLVRVDIPVSISTFYFVLAVVGYFWSCFSPPSAYYWDFVP